MPLRKKIERTLGLADAHGTLLQFLAAVEEQKKLDKLPFKKAFAKSRGEGKDAFVWRGKKYSTAYKKTNDTTYDKLSFQDAFSKNRGMGKKEFVWKGSSYSTRLSGESKEEHERKMNEIIKNLRANGSERQEIPLDKPFQGNFKLYKQDEYLENQRKDALISPHNYKLYKQEEYLENQKRDALTPPSNLSSSTYNPSNPFISPEESVKVKHLKKMPAEKLEAPIVRGAAEALLALLTGGLATSIGRWGLGAFRMGRYSPMIDDATEALSSVYTRAMNAPETAKTLKYLQELATEFTEKGISKMPAGLTDAQYLRYLKDIAEQAKSVPNLIRRYPY